MSFQLLFIVCVPSERDKAVTIYVVFQRPEWLFLARLLPVVCVQQSWSRQRCWSHSIYIDWSEGRWHGVLCSDCQNMPMGPQTRVDYCPLFIERVSHRHLPEQLDRRPIRPLMEGFSPHVWKGECFGKVGKSPKFQKPSGRRWSPQVTLKTRRISQYLIRSKCPHTMEYPCVLGLWSLVSSNQSFFFFF